MMLTDYIKEDRIITNFKAAGKREALELLCTYVARLDHLPQEEIMQVVLDREEMGSTGLGGGVALPHGKSTLVKRPALILALAPDGVDFDSLDGRLVQVFVLLLSPRDGDGREHLQLLARLGGLFKSPAAVAEILQAAGPAEVFDFLARREVSP
jgi:Phosphotransferase system mannitol/fructose-specific IIA domain (Ntr-type)